MFDGATAFNSSVSTLDMSDVTNASEMFQGATSFDQSVSAWDVAKVTNFSKAFKGPRPSTNRCRRGTPGQLRI